LRVVYSALFCISAVAQKQEQEHAHRAGWVLNFDGIGAVKVGMTLRQVNAVLGEHFSTPTGEDEKTCFYVQPKQHPDTGIMVLDGRVARVDVFAPDHASPSTGTAAGIHIGDSESRVASVYGDKVQVSPHHYTDGHYLTVESGKYGLRFETDEGKVTGFYAGNLRAIALVEGCS
jgi:outer membrane protein assembly factor BamE (lipoprotein component of BamABCDE complex)